MTIFVKLDLMMEFKIYQICSAFDYTTTTIKILIYAGNKQFHQQVIPSRQKSGRSVLVIITGFDSTSDFFGTNSREPIRSGGEPRLSQTAKNVCKIAY